MVRVRGKTVLIGAAKSDGRRGAVYAYTWQDMRWHLVGSLTDSDENEPASYGTAIASTDSHFAIGAQGRVELYKRADNTSWEHVLTLEGPDTGSFGTALAATESTLWIGARNDDSDRGVVYAYSLGTLESELQRVAPQELPYKSRYGAAIAAANQAVLVGSVGHDNFEGAAYAINAPDMSIYGPIYGETGEFASVTGDMTQCEDGEAAGFPCSDVDMISFLTRGEVGAKRAYK